LISLNRRMFHKVTIVGIGLIGGSLGKIIKTKKLAHEVVGVSQRQSTLTAAIKMNAVDKVYTDVKKAVVQSDFVVLATPISIINSLLMSIGPHLKRNCIITDVGSTKVSIVKMAQEYLPPSAFFVGSHPLAGSEKKGVQNADINLFQKSLCLMTPTDKTHKKSCDKVRRFWIAVGSKVKYLSPEEHDLILAYTSHAPHLIAYALMDIMPKQYFPFCGQGLKDTTRIAASTPQVWLDICMANSRNIIQVIDECVSQLSAIRKTISTKETKDLLKLLQEAKEKRDSLTSLKR